MKPGRARWSEWVARRLATLNKASVRQWSLAVAVYVALAVIVLANVVTERVDLTAGQVATRDINASHRVINRYATELQRAAAEDAAVKAAVADPASYVISQAVEVQARETISLAFRALAEADGNAEAARQSVFQATGMDVPVDVAASALDQTSETLAFLEQVAVDLVSDVLRSERISDDNIDAVRKDLEARLPLFSPSDAGEERLGEREKEVVLGLAAPAIQPNLVLDTQRVNRAKDAAARAVQPIYVERSQSVLRKGDLVTEEHLQILQDLGLLKTRANYASALGVSLILALMIGLFGVYLHEHKKAIVSDEGHLALLGLVLILVAGLAKALSLFPSEAAGYLVPVALGTMLIAILLDAHVAIMAAVFMSVIVGMVMGHDLQFALIALVSGLTGVFSVTRAGERSDLTRAGVMVGLVSFGSMVALGLWRSDAFLLKYSFLGAVNGLASAVGTIGLFPFLESLFRITSSIRLLELSNPNQPLLRKLLMEAPGTYHHSMIVGNLSEAAAEAIGGDSLLTRVGAQYHDVGKTKRPYFFIENQYGGENPHDKIAPSLSTLIVTSHVKDGVELARQYKLPECVIDFIRQHHGTTLVKYFYHKALENAKADNAKDEKCDEKDFRYPGPRPQTKETAIVLLADSVEAAVRTLSRPTPGRIEGLVRKIIKDRLADGQLDESNITLKDLDKIAEAFVRVLMGIFHSRIEYPEHLIKEMEAKRA